MTLVTKIISGINSGVERAALIFASENGVEYCGWVPESQKNQHSILNSDFNGIRILPNTKASDCIKRNVLSSDATLLITCGGLFGESNYYKKIAAKYKKTWLHLDLDKNSPFHCAVVLSKWLLKNKIRVLTVSGSKNSDSAGIEKTVKKIFEALWIILLDERHPVNPAKS